MFNFIVFRIGFGDLFFGEGFSEIIQNNLPIFHLFVEFPKIMIFNSTRQQLLFCQIILKNFLFNLFLIIFGNSHFTFRTQIFNRGFISVSHRAPTFFALPRKLRPAVFEELPDQKGLVRLDAQEKALNRFDAALRIGDRVEQFETDVLQNALDLAFQLHEDDLDDFQKVLVGVLMTAQVVFDDVEFVALADVEIGKEELDDFAFDGERRGEQFPHLLVSHEKEELVVLRDVESVEAQDEVSDLFLHLVVFVVEARHDGHFDDRDRNEIFYLAVVFAEKSAAVVFAFFREDFVLQTFLLVLDEKRPV